MLYKNTVTGAVIETECVISGENWEEITTKSKRTGRAKKTEAEEPEKPEK